MRVFRSTFALASCVLVFACQPGEQPAAETSKGAAGADASTAAPNEGFTLADALEGLEGEGTLLVKIETTEGEIIGKLFEDKVPSTVANFVGLARGKKKHKDVSTNEWKASPFYDGLTFHRVIPNFMIQGGDPLGTGRGGPGYTFADELRDDLRHSKPGMFSMANAGANTNGSQFFISEVPLPHLDGRHTVFGEVVEGLDVVKKIARMKRGPGNHPAQTVSMRKVTIYRGEPS